MFSPLVVVYTVTVLPGSEIVKSRIVEMLPFPSLILMLVTIVVPWLVSEDAACEMEEGR